VRKFTEDFLTAEPGTVVALSFKRPQRPPRSNTMKTKTNLKAGYAVTLVKSPVARPTLPTL